MMMRFLVVFVIAFSTLECALALNVRLASAGDFSAIHRLLKRNQTPWIVSGENEKKAASTTIGSASSIENAFEAELPTFTSFEDAFWFRQLKLAVEQSGSQDSSSFFVATAVDESVVGTICLETITKDVDTADQSVDGKDEDGGSDADGALSALLATLTADTGIEDTDGALSDLLATLTADSGVAGATNNAGEILVSPDESLNSLPEEKIDGINDADDSSKSLNEDEIGGVWSYGEMDEGGLAANSDGGCFLDQVYFSHMAVEDKYRRTGVGTALLKAAFSHTKLSTAAATTPPTAETRGGCCLFVNSKNDAALAFYRANGFYTVCGSNENLGSGSDGGGEEAHADVAWLRESTGAEDGEVLMVTEAPVFSILAREPQ